jgi:ElaB/YqjD/DUF883 family membrane-anchored ribosome-binding protein
MSLSQRQGSEAAGLDKLEQLQREMSNLDNGITQLKSEIEGIEAYANHILNELTKKRNKEMARARRDIESLLAKAKREGITMDTRYPNHFGGLATG